MFIDRLVILYFSLIAIHTGSIFLRKVFIFHLSL